MTTSGRDDHDPLPLLLQRRSEAGPDQRGLARTGRAHDCQHAVRGEPAQAGGHLRLTSEEPLGVDGRVGDQAGPRAAAARLGHGVRRRQRPVLAQDRLLQRDQIRSGVETELADEDAAGFVDRAERSRLVAGLVCASARSAHLRSRVGRSSTRARATANTSRWRPARSAASSWASSAPRHSSVSRCASMTPGSQSSTSVRGGRATGPVLRTGRGQHVRVRRASRARRHVGRAARSVVNRPNRPEPRAGSRAGPSLWRRGPAPSGVGRCNPAPPCSTLPAASVPTGHRRVAQRTPPHRGAARVPRPPPGRGVRARRSTNRPGAARAPRSPSAAVFVRTNDLSMVPIPRCYRNTAGLTPPRATTPHMTRHRIIRPIAVLALCGALTIGPAQEPEGNRPNPTVPCVGRRHRALGRQRVPGPRPPLRGRARLGRRPRAVHRPWLTT